MNSTPLSVVDLVLQAGREQAVGLDLLRLAVEIDEADLHLAGRSTSS